MNLSKSKYCNAIQCKKMLWLDKHKPEVASEISNDAVMDNGNQVHELARNLFGSHINIEYNDNLDIMINDTKKALEKKQVVITEASFKFENNFCSVDILKKDGDMYEMYEVKGSTSLKDIFVKDASYQYYVLTNLGYKISKCYLVHLNPDYVRNGELDLEKLFVKVDITDKVYELIDEVKKNISEINEYMRKVTEPEDDIDNKCFKPYECPYFKYCTRNIPLNNVFDIRGMYKSTKMKLYKKGIYEFKDLLKEDINDIYKQQIEYELYDKEDYIDIPKIKEFMETLTYPLYFLDFETYQEPIPPYDGLSPYIQIPFQYSLHYIENENAELEHKEYLSQAGIDPRRMLAERLVNDIPKNVTVLAYNMMFEKMVIRHLADIYPDLSDHLLNIYDNIKDLMIPFKDRSYYTRAMHGSYSIKYVLPALFPDDKELDYHNLDLIHNGAEAMNSFANLGNLSKEELEYTRERLLRYCELDTYAMVKIYKKLKKIINN